MMDIERLQNLQADRQSACQSLGSNRQPCSQSWKKLDSQSRKMSIGIVVDSIFKPIHGQTEEDKPLRLSGESKNNMEKKNEKKDVQSIGKGSRFEAEQQEGSPWITPRSVKRNKDTRWSPDIPERTPNAAALGTSEREARSSVQNGANRAVAASGDGKQKEFDGMSCRRENENRNSATSRIAYAAADKVYGAKEGVLQDRTNLPENRSKETLIMNLWKTLGTPASPIKQHVDSQKTEACANDTKRVQNKYDKLDMFDKPSKTKQSSDTIEPDSESPVQATKRAVTRSLTRKRASNKLCTQKTAKKQVTPGLADSKKVTRSQSSVSKVRQRKSVICFDEKWFSINPNTASAISIPKKNSGKESGGIKSTDTSSPAADMGDLLSEHISRKRSPSESKKDAPVKGKQTMDSPRSSKLKDKMEALEGPTSNENAGSQKQIFVQSLQNNGIQNSDVRSPVLEKQPPAHTPFRSSAPKVNVMKEQYHQPAEVKADCFDRDAFTLGSKLSRSPTSVKEMHKKNSCSSKIKHRSGNMEDPTSVDNAANQSHPHGRFQRSVGGAPYDIRSPGIQKKIDVPSPSRCSFPQANEIEHHYKVTSHAEAEFSRSKSRKELTRSPDNSGSDTMEPSGNTLETKDSPDSDPEMPTGEKNNEGDQFTFKRQKFDNIEEDVLKKVAGFTEDIDNFPEISVLKKPIFRRNKRFRINEDDIHSEFSPIFGSSKETGDMMDASQQTQEDGLSRAVTLFGLALEKVRGKLVSAMKKRCSYILASSGEEIQQQLQLVESRIHNDIGKLTAQSRSKRKSLETRFQELQEQLDVIHEKFKEEIDRHLQYCRNSVEELEAEETELGGAVERQKASQRKLLMQVEEAVQSNLVDVERRVASVHESGREKMLQLKLALAECLKDGTFT